MNNRPPELALAAGRATVGGLFRSRATANPESVAIIDGARKFTYAQLDSRTNRLANAMTRLGLGSGDRVAILAHNCAEYLDVELAAAKTGAIVAALNWRLGKRELAHCINLVEPKIIIAQADLAPVLDDLDIPAHERILFGDGYESLLAGADDRAADVAVAPEDGLVILYTSGTTGLPKGALISHRAMVARAMCFASELQVPVGDNFVAWAPFYHMASTDQSIATLLRSGTVHVVDGYQPDQLIDILEGYVTRWFVLVPGVVGDFAAHCQRRRAKIKHVGICGAMPDLVPRDEIAAATRALNAPYLNTFGSTETGLPPATGATIAIGLPPTSLSKRQSTFCDLRLVDPEDRDVATGTPGEVALRGPTLFSGYWNAEETNAKDFRNGWFHMGDVMRRNADGTLDYVDRVKYMIKSGGENIYPAEIEQVLLADTRIAEAVVVGKKDPKWGEVPVAFVVRRDGRLTETDVLANCKAGLSSYKQPKSVIFIEAGDLPRSTTGKVQRHLLERRL